MIPNSTCWFQVLSLWFVAQRSIGKQHGCILLNSNGKNTPLKIFTALLNDPKNERWGWHNCKVEWLADTPIRRLHFQLVKEFAKLQLFGWKQPSPGVCLGDDLFENLQPNILELSEKKPIEDWSCCQITETSSLRSSCLPMFGAGLRMGVAWEGGGVCCFTGQAAKVWKPQLVYARQRLPEIWQRKSQSPHFHKPCFWWDGDKPSAWHQSSCHSSWDGGTSRLGATKPPP